MLDKCGANSTHDNRTTQIIINWGKRLELHHCKIVKQTNDD